MTINTGMLALAAKKPSDPAQPPRGPAAPKQSGGDEPPVDLAPKKKSNIPAPTGNADQDAVVDGLLSGWLENSEKMIQKNYGIGGNNNPFTVDLDAFTDGRGGTLARVTSNVEKSGPGTDIRLELDMADAVPANMPNGGTYPFYNDRVIAHEMTHAVMATGQSWGELASDKKAIWFIEGVAEFTHGAKERVQSDGAKATLADNIEDWGGRSVDYSSGYLAVRYLHQQTDGKGVKAMLQYLQNTPGQTLDDAFKAVTPWASTDDFKADFDAHKAEYLATFDFKNGDTGAIGGFDADGGPVLTAESVVNDTGELYGTDVLAGFDETWQERGSSGATQVASAALDTSNAQEAAKKAAGKAHKLILNDADMAMTAQARKIPSSALALLA